ncbi:aminotransferase class V-fold PLP-dependent enzyme [Kocuria carniphila]|uniref:aminotransferase class V-fold PLP-dependent enzyme n=1 Tax=Kocuria carniphila TaxID=262208 RepID=UPI0021A87703|nr:SufS family cysteine desulfurase [Kocuria carniphila]MCT1801710.1 SufS family cysteine desulfurase [Kocuria carniphila]
MTTTPLDNEQVLQLKQDFPLLTETQVAGHPLVYLDTGATSQVPRAVADAERDFTLRHRAAVHRGAHTLAVEATDFFEDARATVSRFVGADPYSLVWTSNATEGLNLLSYAMSNATAGSNGSENAERFRVGPGDEIVTTQAEHHANLIPWQELAARTGATLRVVPVNERGLITPQAVANTLSDRTKLVAFTHVSNVTGAITDVPGVVAEAQKVGALTVLDACQSVPHMPIDFPALGVDFAVFSAHKMLGPTGIGALYGRRELLNALPTFLTGGSMITKVTTEHARYLDSPVRFEAGTQRISQAVAWAEAVRYLEQIGMNRIEAWEAELGGRLARGITEIDGVRLLGPEPGVERVGLASIDVAGVHAHDVGQLLDVAGIAVRVGHHCAQPLHRELGLTASTRASTYLYNTTDDVDRFLDELSRVRGYFRVEGA